MMDAGGRPDERADERADEVLLDPNFVPEGWLDSPPAKKRRLSLSLKERASTSSRRFATPVSEVQYIEAAEGVVPANTKKNNDWGERVFRDWLEERNKLSPTDPVPEDLLAISDSAVVSKYLRYFVMEVRTKDGTKYPPATIRCILSALNRIYRKNSAPFSILDKGNPAFKELHLTLDRVTSDLHREGVGVNRKSAEVITIEHENIFWEKQLLGYETPKALQRAVFFAVGLNFVLRGVQEHHDLTPQQLIRYPPDTSVYSEDVYYQYTEYISKNNLHRFKDINSTNKSCRVYAQPDSDKCAVRLIDFYISKLPDNPPAFYLRPLGKVPTGNRPWFCRSRVGINKLKTFVPEISAECGIDVHYTNHSLRATAVTRMYNAGVPEALIAEKSGHKSMKALRAYERTSKDQEKSAGRSIQQGKEFSVAVVGKENCAPEPVLPPKSPMDSCSSSTRCGGPNVGPLQQFSQLTNCTFNFYQK